jgi:hypothetical protein
MRNGAIIPFTDAFPIVESAPLLSNKNGYSKAAEAASESQLAGAGVSDSGAGSSTAATDGHGHNIETQSPSTSVPANVETDNRITPSARAPQGRNAELLDEMRILRERVTQLESRTNVNEAPPGYQE